MKRKGGEQTRFFAGTGRELFRVLIRVAVLAFVALVIGIILFARGLERRDQRAPFPADGIVVLTGGADRINEALQLLEQGMGKRLVISGVNIHSTAEALKRRWPGREKLFDCCIDLDYSARNTYGNAIETRRWVDGQGFKSLILVTASYHLPRAMLEFEHAMPGITIEVYPVVPEASRINRWWQEPALTRIIVMEFIKYWAASLRLSLGLAGG
jgi:uncharacterized SAM-binding protein YcdF (DUF218 family)